MKYKQSRKTPRRKGIVNTTGPELAVDPVTLMPSPDNYVTDLYEHSLYPSLVSETIKRQVLNSNSLNLITIPTRSV